MNLRTNQKGFTIIELLIVIVVIAILAAISIVAYTGIQDRARNTAAQSLASQVAKQAEIYHAFSGKYPDAATDFTGEAALESLKVTFGTGGPLAATPVAANLNDSSTAVKEFTNGNRVLYVGDDDGYSVVYRINSSIGEITKGTPPSGTWAYVSDVNL